MRYVMIVNIGPVQSFIAAARRTRDLWYGSRLLSELSRTAAAEIMQAGGDLIFPAITRGDVDRLVPDQEFNVVNRIVALVEGEPERIAAVVDTALTAELRRQWDIARSDFGGTLYNEDEALAQVLDLLECTWAAAPCPTDDDYRAARETADQLLAARKSTRNFAPVTWGARRPKSSLDGLRESVIPEDRYAAAGDSEDEQRRKADVLYRQYGAGRAERLSAVDLLKRHGSKEFAARARSTSHIAARPFVARLRSEAPLAEPLLRNLIDDLEKANFKPARLYSERDGLLGYDAYLLYEMRLRDEAQDQGRTDEEIEAAVAALAEFYRGLALSPSIGARRPSPYYALLLGDGDNMGQVVDAQQTPDGHRAISRDLSTFAGAARTIVTDHDGFPIYSGGDDIMALIPLHTLLDCAADLHAAFETAVGKYRSAPEDGSAPVSPSLSIGVVIAHHLEPLGDVLALARRAEKTAKAYQGRDGQIKNALAIILSKRSGADRMVVGRWPDDIAGRLRSLIDLMRQNVIPEGAAYEILHMHRTLTPRYVNKAKAKGLPESPSDKKERELAANLPAVMVAEARRILKRKRGERGGRPIDKAMLAKLRGYMEQVGVEELANELILAGVLYRAERLAQGGATPSNQTAVKEAA